MDIAAGRGVGGVHVGVGVDPEEADFLVLAAVELGDAGDRAGRDRVIAAEDEGTLPASSVFSTRSALLGAGGGDFLEILGVGGAFFLLLGDGDGDVAGIFDNVADGFEAGFESGDADGGRAHVDAAAGLAEVERNANHANLARGDVGVGRASLSHRLPIHRRDAECAEKSQFLIYSGCGACIFARSGSGNSFTIRFRPFFRTGTWKFIRRPTLLLASLRYDKSCAS